MYGMYKCIHCIIWKCTQWNKKKKKTNIKSLIYYSIYKFDEFGRSTQWLRFYLATQALRKIYLQYTHTLLAISRREMWKSIRIYAYDTSENEKKKNEYLDTLCIFTWNYYYLLIKLNVFWCNLCVCVCARVSLFCDIIFPLMPMHALAQRKR